MESRRTKPKNEEKRTIEGDIAMTKVTYIDNNSKILPPFL